MPKNGMICAAVNCSLYSKTSGLSFFRFPQDKQRYGWNWLLVTSVSSMLKVKRSLQNVQGQCRLGSLYATYSVVCGYSADSRCALWCWFGDPVWPCWKCSCTFCSDPSECFSCKQERTAVTNYCSCQAPEPIDLKLYTCDYVAHLTPHAIGSNKRPMGLFPNRGEMSPSPTILLLLSLLFDDLLFYYELQYLCPETTLLG